MAKGTAARKPAAKKPQRTWIVVADGGHARILESGQPHSGITVRLDATSAARQTAGKLAAGRLPRTQESGSSARHGIEPRLSLKDHEKLVFAARLAGYLKGGIDSFDQLVLVAPTRFLKLVRDALPGNVARKVTVARGKDLTWMTDAEILEHLGAVGRQVRRPREGV
ncbi:MAG: host attachment protein [Dongiaceae bacterium]